MSPTSSTPPARPAEPFRLTVFSSFDEAQDAWLRFQTHADYHGIQSFSWLSHWHRTVGHRYVPTLCLVQVNDSRDRPLLFLPLGIRKRQGASCLTFLGGDITDYHAPLLDRGYTDHVDAQGFSDLWSAVVAELPAHDVVDLEKQPERIANQPNPFLALPGQAVQDINRWSRLEGDWETFHKAQVKASLRGDSRRKTRRLGELGRLAFRVAESPEEATAITKAMIRQKTERYVETGTYSLFNDEAYASFFLEPSPELVDDGLLHVSELALDDRVLATHWGIVWRGRFYFIMASFEGGEWKKYSPGRLLIEHLFRWCFDHGVDAFDFTIGDEEFKRIWSNRTNRLYRYLEPENLKGALYVKAEQAKDSIRSRPALHRWISRMRNPKS